MPSKSPIRGSHETKLLFEKSMDSLKLAIELFNRPSPTARTHAVLMLLDQSVELLIKACLLSRDRKRGIIDPDKPRNTIGTKTALGRALSSGAGVRFLTVEQHGLCSSLNLLRDAAQHHLGAPSEEQLYVVVQSTVTLVRDILQSVFSVRLADLLPLRVLPLSTIPLPSIEMLYADKAEEIRKVVLSGARQRHKAREMARPLAIMERGLAGLDGQPTVKELDLLVDRLASGSSWEHEFPETSTLDTIMETGGATINLRVVKRGGIPVHGVDNGDETDDIPIVLREVDLSDRFNLSVKDMADHLGITGPRFHAFRRHLQIDANEQFHRVMTLGKVRSSRFSPKALDHCREAAAALSAADWDAIWETHRPRKGSIVGSVV